MKRLPWITVIVFFSGICLLSCLSNPYTIEDFDNDKRPVSIGAGLLISFVPGLPQLVSGEYVEAAGYAGSFLVPLGLFTVLNDDAPGWIFSASAGVMGASFAFSFGDGFITTLARYLQYDNFNNRLAAAADDIVITDVSIDPVYPSIYKFYEANPAGKIKIVNSTLWEIEDVKVALSVPEFMDFPMEKTVASSLSVGMETETDLSMIFNTSILGVVEDLDTNAELRISFRIGNRDKIKTEPALLRILSRNAIMWDDPGKLAAFVTAKDFPVKSFARKTVQTFADERVKSINQNFQVGMQVFDALAAYGCRFQTDGYAGPERYSRDSLTEVKFPRDTLRDKSGDSEDFAALYCSLLENIGISTAVIISAGKLIVAFDTGLRAGDYFDITDEAARVVIHDGQVWLPLDVSMIEKNFMQAWLRGSEIYHNADADASYSFTETRASWETFEPVLLGNTVWEPEFPATTAFSNVYLQDITGYIDNELGKSISSLLQKIGNKAHPKWYNLLAVKYAKYERFAEALDAVEIALDMDADFFPALSNAGNIYYLQGDFDNALEYYLKALEKRPDHPAILIRISKAYYLLEDFSLAGTYFRRAIAEDRSYLETHAYLAGVLQQPNDAVAFSVEDRNSQVEWDYSLTED